MRLLFRLIFFILFVSTVYFVLESNASKSARNSNDWVTVSNQSGLSISFPVKPETNTTNRTFQHLGKSMVRSFQVANDNELYVLLITQVEQKNIKQVDLKKLRQGIHEANDTLKLDIQNERYFSYSVNRQTRLPAYEYHAKGNANTTIWCRTLNTGTALLSLIYASPDSKYIELHRDRFFKSLQF